MDPRRVGFGAYADTWGDNLVFDKNGDGLLDVLLSFHAYPWQIWVGTGRGRFALDRKLAATDRHNCAVADLGGPRGRPDGLPDLYCVRGGTKDTLPDKRNALLIQQAKGGFVDEAVRWGVADPVSRGRTAAILQVRRHGRPGLFVGNAESIDYPSPDRVFVNRGGHFAEVHTAGLPSEQNTYCSPVGDVDRDGRQDFLTCSNSLRLYRNLTRRTGGVAYRDVAAREGFPTGPRSDAELVDLNRDGWTDLVTVTPRLLTVRLNRHRTPHFPRADFNLPLAAGASVCTGAANGDKVPDLLVVQGLAAPTDRVQRRDWMLVNSGTGTAFRILPVPQPPMRHAANGNGDTCTSIPHYRAHRAAWVISNGRPTYAPERHHWGFRQLVVLTR